MDRPTRQHLRFPPDEGIIAWVDPCADVATTGFKPTFAALVTDEGLAGCGLVALSKDKVTVDAILRVQVKNLAPLVSQVRWVRELGLGVVKLGVEFLE